ncbi:hypothetical protein QBC47DRAFT_426814 [Echria macrotheca]|uniref:Uncharacterized protein n=1 Tax=Echria macrotheca TaxID=438768 RepID=A0AAJ0B0B2_9PEZI|nr:hypothetical protein QBC47DRAFT_426814 [Echria macrotheca]
MVSTLAARSKARSRESSSKTKPISCPTRPFSHADSGYGTGNNTSFSSLTGKQSLTGDDEPPIPVRSVPLPGKEELQIFRTEIGPAHMARFREITPEIQRELLSAFQKSTPFFTKAKKRKQITMSIRLMMVGDTAETAKPSIIIFLPGGDGASRMESALKLPSLRQLYMPDDGITPCFTVVVVDQAPKKRFCEDIQVVWDTSLSGEKDSSTFCGTQVYLQSRDGRSAISTLGGIVKLTYGPGDFKLVGMTAGHVLEELFDGDDSDEDSDSDEVVGQETQVVDRPCGATDYTTGASIWDYFAPQNRQRPPTRGPGSSISRRCRPIMATGGGQTMTAAPPESFPTMEPIEVALLGGSRSSHHGGSAMMFGVLSHVPGGIMLSPDHGFVDAYLLVLDEGQQEVRDGDSGSWVVNPVSMEVYGHIAATDMTGDAYVLPLHRSFDEMKQVLGVESVDLPRTADLLDAALRGPDMCSAGKLGVGMPVMPDCPRERRASEVFRLCEGLRLRDLKRTSVFYDDDSGYGSLGSRGEVTPLDPATDEVEEDRDYVACW